jgi:hypothetical protein
MEVGQGPIGAVAPNEEKIYMCCLTVGRRTLLRGIWCTSLQFKGNNRDDSCHFLLVITDDINLHIIIIIIIICGVGLSP